MVEKQLKNRLAIIGTMAQSGAMEAWARTRRLPTHHFIRGGKIGVDCGLAQLPVGSCQNKLSIANYGLFVRRRPPVEIDPALMRRTAMGG